MNGIILVLVYLFASTEALGQSTVSPNLDLQKILNFEQGGGWHFRKLTPSDRQNLLAQGRRYARFRKNQLSSAESASMIAGCLSRPGANPFCLFLDDEWKVNLKKSLQAQLGVVATIAPGLDSPLELEEEQADEVVDAGRELNQDEIRNSLLAGEFSKLKAVPQRKIYRVLAKMGDWKILQPTVERALSGASCPSPHLLTALGMKAEEFFPALEMRKAAISLYKKADECGATAGNPKSIDPAAQMARFRMALLEIWGGRCEGVDGLLQKLASESEGLYVTRALYWRARCAEKAGNKMLYSLLQNQIMKANPLGYHTLLLNKNYAKKMVNQLDSGIPKVIIDSTIKNDLNTLVHSVEVLTQIGEAGYAREILRVIETHMSRTEPAFRLYLAVLARDLAEPIQTFRILSTVFTDQSSLITRDTLRMFYPLKHMAALGAIRGKLDPFFVAALIRQESGFNVSARSRTGAMGLMQLMPQTAKQMGHHDRKSLNNPGTNIQVGVQYLSGLLKRFGGDAELALASYNAGPMKVDNWLSRYVMEDRMLFLDLIPFSETRNYVVLIGRNYFWYLNLYANENLPALRNPIRQIASRSKTFSFTALADAAKSAELNP